MNSLNQQDFENTLIEIRGWTDGGPNDRGYRIGYMENKPEYWRPATENDHNWAKFIETQSFADAYKAKFDTDWDFDTAFVTTRVVDRKQYEERLAKLKKELNNFSI